MWSVWAQYGVSLNLHYQLLQGHVDLAPLFLRDVKTLGTSEKTMLVLSLHRLDETGDEEAVPMQDSQRESSNIVQALD